MSISLEWLEKTNEEFRCRDTPLDKRPFLALLKYSNEIGESFFGLGTESSKDIFDWYKKKYNLHLNNETGNFQSVYYIDSEFWKVSVPLVYGKIRLDPFNSLENMPKKIKDELFENSQNSWDYQLYWASCIDYAFGYDQLLNNQNINKDGLSFFKAADQDLRKAITHHVNRIDNSTVVWDSRNALEKFIKAMIGFKVGLTEDRARSLNHNLSKNFAELIRITGYVELEKLQPELNFYPSYADRYAPIQLDKLTQWKCFKMAQLIGAVVVCEFSETNMVRQLIASAASK